MESMWSTCGRHEKGLESAVRIASPATSPSRELSLFCAKLRVRSSRSSKFCSSRMKFSERSSSRSSLLPVSPKPMPLMKLPPQMQEREGHGTNELKDLRGIRKELERNSKFRTKQGPGEGSAPGGSGEPSSPPARRSCCRTCRRSPRRPAP